MSVLARNIRASVVEYAFTAVGIAINLLVIRYLGAEQYGLFTYALSVIGILSAILGLGCFDQVFLREQSKGGDTAHWVWAMLWFRLAGAFLVLPGVLIYVAFVDTQESQYLGLLLIAWSTVFVLFRDTFRISLVAAQKIGLAVQTGLLVTGLGWVARLLALWFNAPMPVFLLIISGEGVVAGCVYYLAWRRHLATSWKGTGKFGIAFRLSVKSWPLFVTTVAGVAFSRIDQVILFHLIDSRSTGLYGSMVWILERTFFLSGVVMGSFFPYLSSVQARDPVWYERSLRVGYKVMGLSAVPAAFVCSLYSTDILKLCLGRDFMGGETAFAVLVWSLPFIFWGALNQKHLLIHNLLKTDMVFATLSALLNLSLNLTLIPRFGLTGAAISFVAGHGLYFFLQWFLPNLRGNSQSILTSLALPLAACSVCALIVSCLPVRGLMAVGLFLVQYAILVWIVCALPLSDDYATIARQVMRAGGFAPRIHK